MAPVHSPVKLVSLACWLFLFAQLGWLAGCQYSSELANDNDNAEVTIAAMLEAANGPRRDPFLALTNRLKQLAGETATDCGVVRVNQKPDTATACALSTHVERKPFYVSYSEWGIDNYGATAFAADADGNVYRVDYDSGGWDKFSLRKNVQLSDGNQFVIKRCSKSVKLRKSADGRVTCFLRDP